MTLIQTVGAPDLARILALNNAHAVETSFLDEARLEAMLDEAFLANQNKDCRSFDC